MDPKHLIVAYQGFTTFIFINFASRRVLTQSGFRHAIAVRTVNIDDLREAERVHEDSHYVLEQILVKNRLQCSLMCIKNGG